MSAMHDQDNKKVSDIQIKKIEHDSKSLSDEINTDTGQTVILGLLTVVLGFGAFLVWAAYAPLDEGVPAQAQVIVESKRKTIQHMTGGNILNLVVREGQYVKEGDVLVELSEGEVRANYESTRQTYMAQRATESRLLAELQNASSIKFHPDLTMSGSDPLVKQHIDTQRLLFEARRNSLNSEIKATEEAILGHEAELVGILGQLESRKLQVTKQLERLNSFNELAKDGYVAQNQILQLEQEQAGLVSVVAELDSARVRTRNTINELKNRLDQRRQDFLKESSTQLAEVSREVLAGRERLDATRDNLSRIIIKSPVDGQVVGIAVSSAGGVISPGQRLMDIVPKDEVVVLEAKLPIHLIDRIKVGDAVSARFSSFSHSPQLVVDCVLTSISDDVLTETASTGTVSYYLGRAQLTKNGFVQLGDHAIKPGMGAEVLIKTGERSLLTYLMGPLLKRVSSAMREE